MLRSDRNRKQPESFYRLQEEDYRMRNKRVVVTDGTADSDEDVDESQQRNRSHNPRPRKVARISEDTSSKKGGSNNRKLKTKGSSNANGIRENANPANANTANAKELWEGKGHTKLGFFAQRLAIVLQTRPRGAISFREAKQLLEINSRRLYDILHVLDGAGLVTIDRTCKSNSIITWNQSPCSLIEQLQCLHNQQLQEELNKMQDWMSEMKSAHHQPNPAQKGAIGNVALDSNKLYITKNELWKQRQGGVDLILAPQPGAVLHVPTTPMSPLANRSHLCAHQSTYSFQLVSPTPLKMPSLSSTDSIAFILEDNGILKSLDLGAPPPPLLASCCSDFSLLHLAPPSLTASTSDWSFYQRAGASL